MAVEIFDMQSLLKPGDTRSDDILAISDLWSQIGDSNTDAIDRDPERLRSIMKGLDYLVLRQAETPRVIGAVSIMDCKRKLAKIDSLAVHPEHQGQGHGRTLAESAVRHCVQAGFKEVVTTAMLSSQHLFDSLGFETYERYDSGNATMFLDL